MTRLRSYEKFVVYVILRINFSGIRQILGIHEKEKEKRNGKLRSLQFIYLFIFDWIRKECALRMRLAFTYLKTIATLKAFIPS